MLEIMVECKVYLQRLRQINKVEVHEKVSSVMVTDLFNFLPLLLRLMHLSLENHENTLSQEDTPLRNKTASTIKDLIQAAYQTQS